jgi:predicted TIM-barrel fold metal-dependent hydrolase
MPRVDCQSHVFPKAYAELLCDNSTWVRTVRKGSGYLVSYGDTQQFLLTLAPYDPAAKLRDMDAAGIDVTVLTVNIPGPELLTPELGVRGARICNEYLAELCARHPGRFVGLATLPLQDMPSAMAEYRRAIHELGLRGIFLFSHIAGKPLDAPEFAPLYAAAERDGVPLVLHPTVPTWADAIKDYAMIPMVGLMVDTSFAMLRLILSGTLERHPDLLVVHPHCGGVLPYLMPRIEEQTEVKRRGREHIRKPPGEYYRNVYLDIVSPSALAMEFAYRSSRPDRLLFGSDHPWVKIEAILEHFNRLQIPDAEKAMILDENPCRLFRIQ